MNTRPIDTLLEIMADPDLFTRRRIEAAEALLAYEAPPEVVERARAFLTSVFEDDEQSVQDRLDALSWRGNSKARRLPYRRSTPRSRKPIAARRGGITRLSKGTGS